MGTSPWFESDHVTPIQNLFAIVSPIFIQHNKQQPKLLTVRIEKFATTNYCSDTSSSDDAENINFEINFKAYLSKNKNVV